MTVTINGTTGVAGVDGTAATPAIQGNDTNTGIFFPAADTIAFAEGGAEIMRINSSGNVGVGTASPNGKLDVAGTIMVSSTDGNSGGIISTSGEASLSNKLVLNGSRGAGGIVFQANSAEAMRIDSSGRLLINTTTQFTTGGFNPLVTINNGADGIALPNMGNGYIGYITRASGSHTYYAGYFLNSSNSFVGSITCTTSATSYTTASDYRLKENIAPMTGALDKVAQLKPVTYTWKADGSASEGFIAHELAEVCPDAVTGEKDAVNEDGTIKAQGIDTSFLVATLTAAIQEQQAIITDLKARIETLENK